MNQIYIVVSGETCQGGSVEGARTRLDEAEILALLQPAHFGEWNLVEDNNDGRSFDDGDTIKEWKSGCDFVRIEVWNAR